MELRHVHGWVHLGLCLDLPKHSLDEIHTNYSSVVDALGKCKMKMLALWLKRSKDPTWSTFIAALLDARLWGIASKIAAKYGEFVECMLYHLNQTSPPVSANPLFTIS